MGEYSALHLSGALPFAETLALVDKRGEFMNDACEETQGTMAVVLGLDAETVEALVKEAALPHDLWVANFNCPGQSCCRGRQRGLHTEPKRRRQKGPNVVLPLKVHGAFHSGLMRRAEERLAPYVAAAPLVKGASALVMNVPGTVVTEDAAIRSFLVQQVTHPVRWEQSIRWMAAQGVDLFVENWMRHDAIGL